MKKHYPNRHEKAFMHFRDTQPELIEQISRNDVVVLHHKDVELKRNDPARYRQWRPEDLVPMGKREHISLHNKGKTHSQPHNDRIQQTVSGWQERRKGTVVMAYSPEGNPLVFHDASEAARHFGCSVQWANRCVNEDRTFHGWRFCLVPTLSSLEGTVTFDDGIVQTLKDALCGFLSFRSDPTAETASNARKTLSALRDAIGDEWFSRLVSVSKALSETEEFEKAEPIRETLDEADFETDMETL